VGLNLEFLAKSGSAKVAQLWYVNDWERFEWDTPLFLDIVLFAEALLGL